MQFVPARTPVVETVGVRSSLTASRRCTRSDANYPFFSKTLFIRKKMDTLQGGIASRFGARKHNVFSSKSAGHGP